MKSCQVLGKYFEVYGQGNQITPEAGKKKAPFFFKIEKKPIQTPYNTHIYGQF